MSLSSPSAHVRRVVILLAFAALTATGGCVYRLDIQQGNLLDLEQIDQVTVGMTRSQVRYLLGTPMINDPFAALRWDYVFTYKRGHQRAIDRGHVIVHFDGDKVSKVEKLDLTAMQEYELANPAPAPGTAAAPAAVEATPPPPTGS
jgi:outer membrane protein assembly factor BamE